MKYKARVQLTFEVEADDLNAAYEKAKQAVVLNYSRVVSGTKIQYTAWDEESEQDPDFLWTWRTEFR